MITSIVSLRLSDICASSVDETKAKGLAVTMATKRWYYGSACFFFLIPQEMYLANVAGNASLTMISHTQNTLTHL